MSMFPANSCRFGHRIDLCHYGRQLQNGPENRCHFDSRKNLLDALQIGEPHSPRMIERSRIIHIRHKTPSEASRRRMNPSLRGLKTVMSRQWHIFCAFIFFVRR